MNLELLQFGKELIQLCNKIEELKLENRNLKRQNTNLYNDLQLAEISITSHVNQIEKLKDAIKSVASYTYTKL